MRVGNAGGEYLATARQRLVMFQVLCGAMHACIPASASFELGGCSNHSVSLTRELIVAVGTLGTLPEPKMSDFSAFRQVPSVCRVWHAAPRWNLLEQTFAAPPSNARLW